MMPGGVDPYFNHRHARPTPPPPTPPMHPNPPSSSALSPLARPFTLDYVFSSPPPPPPSRYHTLPPVSPPAADRPSASRLPLFAFATGSLLSQLSSGAVGDPCRARYCSDTQPWAFEPSSSLSGGGAEPWNGPFDAAVGRGKRTDVVSSWAEAAEPSLDYLAASFPEELAADCCSHYDNDSYGIWHGKFADQMTQKKPFGSQSPQWTQDKHSENFTQGFASSYSIFGDPFSTPSALLGVHYSEAVSSTSEMGPHDSVASNPCDTYMAQLDSCTLNRLAFDPSSTCSTSSQAYAPSNFRATSKINSATSSVTVHELPYKSSDSLIIPSRSKEVNVNQSLGGSQGGYDEKIREEHNITKSAVTVSSEHRGNNFPSNYPTIGNNFPSNYPTIGSPLNLSVFIPELSLKKVVISDASPSRRSSIEPDKFFNSSLDALDQHNLAIDSPCWKGTPSSRQSPFGIAEVLVAGTAYEESNYLNDSCQDQKHFLDCVGRLENCAEQVGRLFPEEDKKKYISDKPQCSPVVSSITRQNLESTNKQLSDCRKDSKDEILSNAVRREQVHQTIEVEEKVSEARDFDALYHVEAEYIAANKSPPAKGIDDHQTESFAVNKFPPAKGIDNNKTGSCWETQKSTKELVKAIHSSSVELVSTNFCNNYELDPRDHRLLYSVINNISLVLKDKKDLVGPSGHCSCMNAALCFNRCSHAKDVSRSNMKGKICSVVRNNVNNESGILFPEGGDADLKKVQHVTQTFENVLSETFSEREENAQTSLYKNLWIEAEVAICKLKYALQLALRRTESENFRPTPSDVSSSLPFLHDLREHNSPLKASEGSVSSKLNESEDVELSVTARAKVLKDRIVSSSDKSTQGQGTVEPKVAGICPGDYGNIHGSPDAENNSATNELPTDFAELGFMDSAAQPYARCYAAADDDFGPRINILGCSNTTQMYSDSMNGSPIRSYMTYQQGTWPRTRGHENPSTPFDWEHVPREEATQ